jgi:hypothetical protein
MNAPRQFHLPFTAPSIALAALLLACLPGRAATLVQYAMSSTTSALARTEATTEAAGLSATNLTGNNLNTNSLVNLTSVSPTTYYTGWSRSAGFSGTTALQALTDATYFTLTITPDAGQAISLNTISFNAVAGTAGPNERQIYVFSDKTGYTTGGLLFSRSTEALVNPTTPLIPYNTTTSDVNFSFDLSGNSTFQNITDSVTFRFYIQTPTVNQNLAFQSLTFEGSVIPEPSVSVLLGLGLFLLLAGPGRRCRILGQG